MDNIIIRSMKEEDSSEIFMEGTTNILNYPEYNDIDKAKEVLGWKPELNSLEDIISTAWKWHSTHPNGYAE